MLHLVRYKNLVFIAAIQLLMIYAIISPSLAVYGLQMQTAWWIWLLIVVATVCIAAGGYVINDYFDLKIDRINKPDKVLIGRQIEKKTAMRLYQILTVVGVLAGLAAAVVVRNVTLGLVFVVVPGMLWFYSASYKRQFLVGNLIVALSAALTPLLPAIVESGALSAKYGVLLLEVPFVQQTLYGWGCGFALFAFLWTLIREVIKDMQDEYGDREMECRTVPIVCGTLWTKIAVTALVVATNALLTYFVMAKIHLPDGALASLRYFLIGIALPSVCLLIVLWRKQCNAYQQAAALCKFIMVVGVLYSLLYNFLIARAFHVAFLGLFYVA